MNKSSIAILLAAFFIVSSCKQEADVKQENVAPYVKSDSPSQKAMENQNAIPEVKKRVPPADGKYPVLTFTETEHDFGNINPKDQVQYVFKFKNSGEADLIIDKAVGSCGCTVPEYPKEPLKPGQSGEMKVSFNPTGKHGQQTKTVTINSNTEAGVEKLTIKASISDAAKLN